MRGTRGKRQASSERASKSTGLMAKPRRDRPALKGKRPKGPRHGRKKKNVNRTFYKAGAEEGPLTLVETT